MKKILVIRFSSIGDIVLTTPVVRCLKSQLPGVQVHYLTRKFFAPMLRANPNIDKVFELDNDLDPVLELLKAEQYDQVIDLHHNIRSLKVKRALNKPSHSFPKLNVEKWLMVNLKWNLLKDIHIVDRYLETVKNLGVVNDGKGLDFFIPKGNEIDPETLPVTHRQGYIGMVIGAKHATKKMPVDRLIAIARGCGFPVVLLGGPEDQADGDAIVAGAGNMVWNAAGKFNLFQSASLVKQASVIITHDTGLMHIAAAFQKKIISIWGNTIPGFGMYPYLPGNEKNSRIFEVNSLNCRPCSKIGYDKCPKGHFKCMLDQDVTQIIEAIRQFREN